MDIKFVLLFLTLACSTIANKSKHKEPSKSSSPSPTGRPHHKNHGQQGTSKPKKPKGSGSGKKGPSAGTGSCKSKYMGSGCGCYQGPAGLMGPQGPPGPQGMQGIQGVQGVQGPSGVPGIMGHPGKDGDKGDRGYKGRKGDSGRVDPVIHLPKPTPHIAFSVTMDENLTQNDEYRIMKFNIILTNIGGFYDEDTGIFTSPINGTYAIGFAGVSYHGQNILLHLVKNGQRLLSAFDNSGCSCCELKKAESEKCAGSGSNMGILSLESGDKVWLVMPDQYGMHNALYHNYASFYGYLIFAH